MPRLGLAGHESVCSPTGHHVTSIGRADRPGQSNTVDEQRLAHPGRPGGAGVLGDHRQHHFTAAPAALPRSAQGHPPHPAQAERRQHVLRRRVDTHAISLNGPSEVPELDTNSRFRVADQYITMSGCICCAQATMPPCRCTASANPALRTAINASADRTPVLQYSTGVRSRGSRDRPSPELINEFGISWATSVWLISHSAGSRTSISATLLPASSKSRSSLGVIAETAASAASSDATPQNCS